MEASPQRRPAPNGGQHSGGEAGQNLWAVKLWDVGKLWTVG